MKRAVALIDGEHYPPVVRAALSSLQEKYEVVGAAFLGGTEKVDLEAEMTTYGVPVVRTASAEESLTLAIERYVPSVVVDLSDEPVVTSNDRFRLAGIALASGAEYRGPDFHFSPPSVDVVTSTPSLGIIGTGKRVGKTAVSAYIARRLKESGRDIVVVAMGRGGPDDPELIRGDEVELTTEDLLALARQGKHAASDNYEDAVMSRVTTIGCRRCGGGMAGETFFSNVVEGAHLADSLGKQLVVFEGSGAAIPPAHMDATILVVGAARGTSYVLDYFGPYRLGRADGVILASAEEPVATAGETAGIRAAIARLRPELPVISTTFRPAPIQPVSGRKVFFATTAPSSTLPLLVGYLEAEYDCEVVGSSSHLSNRVRLREDLSQAAGTFDVLLTELKAAAIDVVASAGDEVGVPTVLCDNVPVAIDGSDLGGFVESIAGFAIERGCVRERGSA